MENLTQNLIIPEFIYFTKTATENSFFGSSCSPMFQSKFGASKSGNLSFFAVMVRLNIGLMK